MCTALGGAIIIMLKIITCTYCTVDISVLLSMHVFIISLVKVGMQYHIAFIYMKGEYQVSRIIPIV